MISRERFESKYIPEPNSGCWLWIGTLTTDGYPHIWNGDRKTNELAHRISYEMHTGPIPAEMTIDHLCRVRSCVNPRHLELVTRAENIRRGENWNRRRSRCACGREFDRIRVDGARECTACQKRRIADWKAKNRERTNEAQRRRRKAGHEANPQ